jgi:hypothetical protein
LFSYKHRLVIIQASACCHISTSMLSYKHWLVVIQAPACCHTSIGLFSYKHRLVIIQASACCHISTSMLSYKHWLVVIQAPACCHSIFVSLSWLRDWNKYLECSLGQKDQWQHIIPLLWVLFDKICVFVFVYDGPVFMLERLTRNPPNYSATWCCKRFDQISYFLRWFSVNSCPRITHLFW